VSWGPLTATVQEHAVGLVRGCSSYFLCVGVTTGGGFRSSLGVSENALWHGGEWRALRAACDVERQLVVVRETPGNALNCLLGGRFEPLKDEPLAVCARSSSAKKYVVCAREARPKQRGRWCCGRVQGRECVAESRGSAAAVVGGLTQRGLQCRRKKREAGGATAEVQ
jgi:hypothetical protein